MSNSLVHTVETVDAVTVDTVKQLQDALGEPATGSVGVSNIGKGWRDQTDWRKAVQ